MILISHRGNINGCQIQLENKPEYIDAAIKLGYDVEVDVWYEEAQGFSLGHDSTEYKIDNDWIDSRANKLWIHCKNLESIQWFNNTSEFNYFWHQEDTVTLTSKNYIWAFPGNQPIKNSIAVIPEKFADDTSECLGVCSDYIKKYDNK